MAPATERAKLVDASSREDPQQSRYWTLPESQRMEDQQTREERLLLLLSAPDYLITVKKVKSALSETQWRKISSHLAYISSLFEDPNLMEPLGDYRPSSLI